MVIDEDATVTSYGAGKAPTVDQVKKLVECTESAARLAGFEVEHFADGNGVVVVRLVPPVRR